MPNSVDPQRFKLTNDEGTTGVLLGFRCDDCGIQVFGPATFCQSCTSSNLEPVQLSSAGILYSYTVIRVPPAGWPGPVPYILGEVELEEGPHVLAEVIDTELLQLSIGMSMELAVQTVKAVESEEAKAVYKWRPLDNSKSAEKDNQ